MHLLTYLSNNIFYRLDRKGLERLLDLGTPSIIERNNILLMYIANNTEKLGQYIPIEEICVSKTWCQDRNELQEIIQYLIASGTIEKTPYLGQGAYKLTLDGWQLIEELESPNAESNQVFTAMWFDESMNQIYSDVISPAIIQAGYLPLRVDERQHNDKIDDEIIAQIRRSKFVVADFTGHRGGVYYEAGFAKGLGLEVIWLCREDHLAQLHFDIRQYNCIVWSEENMDKLKSDLQYRIESVFGRGAVQ